MPKAPWRCSQCGTVNEPFATSCRRCGRWPSLFDLQDSAVEEEAGVAAAELEYEPEPYEIEPYIAEPDVREANDADVVDDGDAGTSSGDSEIDRRRLSARRIARVVIPIGVLLYFLISSYFSNR